MIVRCRTLFLVLEVGGGVFKQPVKQPVKFFGSFLTYRSEFLLFSQKSFCFSFLSIKMTGLCSFSCRTLFLVVEMEEGVFEVKNRFFQKYFL